MNTTSARCRVICLRVVEGFPVLVGHAHTKETYGQTQSDSTHRAVGKTSTIHLHKHRRKPRPMPDRVSRGRSCCVATALQNGEVSRRVIWLRFVKAAKWIVILRTRFHGY